MNPNLNNLCNDFLSATNLTASSLEANNINFPIRPCEDPSDFSPSDIKVVDFGAYFDKQKGTQINADESILRYNSMPFRAHASLSISPNRRITKNWSIGFIQASHFKDVHNIYGGCGTSKWELHPLSSNKHFVVSDSSVSQYPFYDNSKGVLNLDPATENIEQKYIYMDDCFSPTVHWKSPHGCPLSQIYRNQGFIIWLVAIEWHGKNINDNRNTDGQIDFCQDKIYVLKSLMWEYLLEMAIFVIPKSRRQGRKKYHVNITNEKCIIKVTNPLYLPKSAVTKPYCNTVQSLIWYPEEIDKSPVLMVSPKDIIVEKRDWIMDMIGSHLNWAIFLNYNNMKLLNCNENSSTSSLTFLNQSVQRCPLYIEESQEIFRNYYYRTFSNNKLANILRDSNLTATYNLSPFIYDQLAIITATGHYHSNDQPKNGESFGSKRRLCRRNIIVCCFMNLGLL